MTLNNAAQETTPTVDPPASPPAPKWFAAFGLVAGLGAVVASSCCVIPLSLAAVGASASILGGVAMIAEWRIQLLVISTLAIVGGWGAWWWKRPATCVSGSAYGLPQRSRRTLGLLLLVSLIVVLAASWSVIDPVLLKMYRGR